MLGPISRRPARSSHRWTACGHGDRPRSGPGHAQRKRCRLHRRAIPESILQTPIIRRRVRNDPSGGAVSCESRQQPNERWLSGLDSNQGKLLQRELCYLYTTGQTVPSDAVVRVGAPASPRKKTILSFAGARISELWVVAGRALRGHRALGRLRRTARSGVHALPPPTGDAECAHHLLRQEGF